MIRKSDYFFDLPEGLIAQVPIKNRDDSRLMVLDRFSGDIRHKTFRDIIDYLRPGDCLVLNNSKVIPARLFANRRIGTAKIEIMLLSNCGGDVWECMARPGKKAKIGERLIFKEGVLEGCIVDIDKEYGNRFIKFEYSGVFEEILDEIGTMPLPPYIKERLEDKGRYQTVYALEDGSAAAPTAGLHFTDNLLERISNMGVSIAYVTLHVGLGTFRPVKESNILNHKMHSESYSIDEDNALIITNCVKNGGRVICVGTTACRTLESIAENKCIRASQGSTDIFIYEGYKFKIVDAIITNFHLPESTLIMLIAAFCGRDNILNAYNNAILNNYRFFSFGDAMLITGGEN